MSLALPLETKDHLTYFHQILMIAAERAGDGVHADVDADDDDHRRRPRRRVDYRCG